MAESKNETPPSAQSLPFAELIEGTAQSFFQQHGRPHDWIVAAPGRVNLIGEHVDYNGGYVLPLAIERWTVIAGAANESNIARFTSQHADVTAEIALDRPFDFSGPQWVRYLRGVLDGFTNRDIAIDGFDAVIHSSVPVGGGLSSSAALEVATATLLECVTGIRLDPKEKALLCQRAEREFAGVPCGIMDQFASTFCRPGHALLLDCRSQAIEHIAFGQDDVMILIANTNVSHALSDGAYAQRRSDCEVAAGIMKVRTLREASPATIEMARDSMSEQVSRRARHVITEIERTQSFASAMKTKDWHACGRLMYASHASLRDDYEVSCAELDCFVEIAQSIGVEGGVYGCRMTGGGFGGCTVSLVRAEFAHQIARTYEQAYQTATGITPSIFATQASDGARVVSGVGPS